MIVLWHASHQCARPLRFCQNAAMHHLHNDPTDTLPEDIRRTENKLADISSRIARLAMALDAPIATLNDIESILNKETPMLAQPAFHRDQTFLGTGNARLAHEWEELRGLLLLRCDIVTQLIKTHDLHTATTVLNEIEAQLEHEGFQHGDLGFNLLTYLSQNNPTDLLQGEGAALPHPLG